MKLRLQIPNQRICIFVAKLDSILEGKTLNQQAQETRKREGKQELILNTTNQHTSYLSHKRATNQYTQRVINNRQ